MSDRPFSVLDDDSREQLEISAIHDENGYRNIRQSLAEQYNLGSREPDIQIYNVNRRGDRSLTLRHTQHQRRPLAESTEEIVKHIARLWGFTVRLESVSENNKVELTQECCV
ncbi:MAG: SpoVR family protein [Thiogranum sp.]